MHEVFLYLNGTGPREISKFDFLITIWYGKENQFGTTGRFVAPGNFQAEDLIIEFN
jgi:hypothetical protein